MIQFNELRIDSDKNLIVDAYIPDTIDSRVAINHILIGLGSNTEVTEYIDSEFLVRRVVGNKLRGFRLILNLNTLDAATKLIYAQVSVELPVELEVTTDCSIPREIEGYAYDKCLLMNKVFDYIKSTDNICNNIDDYANYIVKINGLQLAVESGNFALANTYWNKFFANNDSNVGLISNTGCGCHQ